jgi:hypothetical protein
MRALKIMLHRRSSPDRAATVCGRPELATFVFCAILFGSLLGPSCALTAGAVRLLRGHPTDGHADCPSVVPPIVDTAAAIAGLWLGRDVAASSTADGKLGLAVALPILAVGATFLVSAIYGYWAEAHCLNAEAIGDLGVQAASAARIGDCATVRAIGAQLSVLDPDFHDTVFAHDAAIVRCLAGNVPAPLPITPAPSPLPETP